MWKMFSRKKETIVPPCVSPTSQREGRLEGLDRFDGFDGFNLWEFDSIEQNRHKTNTEQKQLVDSKIPASHHDQNNNSNLR